MRKDQRVRYVRILVSNNGIPESFTPTLCVRENDMVRSSELTWQEVEKKKQEAAQIFGETNAKIAPSEATSLQEADVFFNNSGVRNADNIE